MAPILIWGKDSTMLTQHIQSSRKFAKNGRRRRRRRKRSAKLTRSDNDKPTLVAAISTTSSHMARCAPLWVLLQAWEALNCPPLATRLSRAARPRSLNTASRSQVLAWTPWDSTLQDMLTCTAIALTIQTAIHSRHMHQAARSISSVVSPPLSPNSRSS